jgi:hypothetical protein
MGAAGWAKTVQLAHIIATQVGTIPKQIGLHFMARKSKSFLPKKSTTKEWCVNRENYNPKKL